MDRPEHWTAVVNPTAGGRDHAPSSLLEALIARGVMVHMAQDATDGQAAARRAFGSGHGVVACGGDGTVASVASIAAEIDGTLAIVPTGTGNDFARHLGIDHHPARPGHPYRALQLLDHGIVQAVDLGRIRLGDGTIHCFTTVAHVGIDADANRRANATPWPQPLRRVSTVKYVLAALRALPRARPRTISVTVDATTWTGRAWLVAVGNARGYGGGMPVTPDALLTDGALDVCVVGAVSRLELLARLPRLRRGTHGTLEVVEMLRGTTVRLETPDSSEPDGGPAELWASGERMGSLPATLDVMPAALRVLVPRRLA